MLEDYRGMDWKEAAENRDERGMICSAAR